MGDDQSIEQSLSTFSAHAAAVAGIIGRAGPNSLVLLDELGTGTEPLQGAAIGCAVLNELHTLGAMAIATTHLTEIVGFVHKTAGMQNAGMEFDSETWMPLYRLVMGEPGQSHALETARRYGLPEHVLAFARELLGDSGTAFAGVIEELRQKRSCLETEILSQQGERLRLDELARRLEAEKREIESLRRRAVEQGREEARSVVTAARRELNQLLDQFRADRKKETSVRLRERISVLETAFEDTSGRELAPDSLKPGAVVHLRALNRDGILLSVDHDRGKARVRAGSMEMDLPLQGLVFREGQARVKGQGARVKGQVDFALSVENPTTEINLIGKRVDDALLLLEKFIDQAVLTGAGEIRIVHGIGTGALQSAVREFLGRHPQILTFRAGESYEGRDGATIAGFV